MASRTSVYSFLIYPDDPNSEGLFKWLENDSMIPNVVSPLHDRDVAEEGEPKKPHYHVLLAFHSLKSMKQVLELLEPFGIQHVEAIHDKRAYIRYLVHLDTPSKAQYDRKDIRTNFGAEVDDAFMASAARVDEAKRELTEFILEFCVTEYAELVQFCIDKSPEYLTAVSKNAFHFNTLMKSVRYFK